MNKKIISFLLIIFLLSGCKKTAETITCTYENNKEGSEYKTETTAEIDKDGIIINAKSVMTFKDKSLAEEMCENFSVTSDSKNVKCKDNTITIKNYHKSLSGDKKLTKDVFLEYMDNKNYICK